MNNIDIEEIKTKIEELSYAKSMKLKMSNSIITIFKLENGEYSINSNKIDILNDFLYSDMINFLNEQLNINYCVYISMDYPKKL